MIRLGHITAGALVLAAGILVYFTDRPVGSALFMERYFSGLSLYGKIPRFFGFIGPNLPGFAHSFSFSMIMGGLFGNSRKDYRRICFFWIFINLLFELGQKFSDIPASLAGSADLRTFFINGTFDPLDLAALTVGGLAAYGLLVTTGKKELSV